MFCLVRVLKWKKEKILELILKSVTSISVNLGIKRDKKGSEVMLLLSGGEMELFE